MVFRRTCRDEVVALRCSIGEGRYALQDLFADPCVRLFHPVAERDARLPVELPANKGVITVAAAYTLGGLQVVSTLELHLGDVFGNIDKLIDRNYFAGTEIDWVYDVALHDRDRPLQAIINVLEAACLLAITPDLNLIRVQELRLGNLSADRGRSFFTSSITRSMRPVHVMVADDSCIEIEVLTEVTAHALTEKFFPSVSVFGHRRIGVGFLERNEVGRRLLVRCIDACRRREEKALYVVMLCSQKKMRVDQHRQHAQRAVVLDKPHAAHVRREIVNNASALEGLLAGLLALQIQLEIFHPGKALVPFIERLDVHGARIRSVSEL